VSSNLHRVVNHPRWYSIAASKCVESSESFAVLVLVSVVVRCCQVKPQIVLLWSTQHLGQMVQDLSF
jgi:hypothetical protein